MESSGSCPGLGQGGLLSEYFLNTKPCSVLGASFRVEIQQ